MARVRLWLLVPVIVTCGWYLRSGSNPSSGSARQIQLPSSPVCWVTQRGKDGFGHQLHGLITAMGLHGLDRNLGANLEGLARPTQILDVAEFQDSHFQFAAHRRKFLFQHKSTNKAVWKEIERYLQSIRSNFAAVHCPECLKPPEQHEFVHETWKIPPDCGRSDKSIVYGLDNAFYGLSKEQCSGPFREAQAARIRELSAVFLQGLPVPDLAPGTTVVHMRLGDSGVRGEGASGRVVALARDAAAKGPLIVETDDADAAKLLLGDTKATIHGKEESVLHALSRMVYADTFLSADSSLSISAALMRPRGNLYMPREIVSGMHFAGKDIGYVKGNCSFILPPATQY